MSQRPLRILITNNTLAGRAGSELYVRDVALAMLRRGHLPVVCSSLLGEVAEELRAKTVPVIDDPSALGEPPDLIHGQHHLDAMMAMLHFPIVPALYFCHGWLPWEEQPLLFPSIRRYVAVDDLCRERLLSTPGIDPSRIRVLRNFVDLSRFQPRMPLPEQPRSALIFSNYATEDNFASVIQRACQAYGIERVDVVGCGAGNSVTSPEALLPQYDLVFAKARAALEAIAVGCSVIVADFPGLGGMVTTENMEVMRDLNFGVRTMQAGAISESAVMAEIARYRADDSAQVSAWIRSAADMEQTMDDLVQLYREVAAERETWSVSDLQACLDAAADHLRLLAPIIKSRWQADRRVQELEQQAELAREALLGALADAERRQAGHNDELAIRDAELALIYGSRAWKLVTAYRKCKAWLLRR